MGAAERRVAEGFAGLARSETEKSERESMFMHLRFPKVVVALENTFEEYTATRGARPRAALRWPHIYTVMTWSN